MFYFRNSSAYLPLLLVAVLALHGAAQAQTANVSPRTRQYLAVSQDIPTDKLLPGFVYKLSPDGQLLLSAFLQVEPHFSEDLLPAGVRAGTIHSRDGVDGADSTRRFCTATNGFQQIHLRSAVGDTLFINVSTEAQSFKGKPRAFLDLRNNTSEVVCLSISSNSGGQVHAWMGIVEGTSGHYGSFSTGGRPWAEGGNNALTVGDMASTKSAITVGAFASKTIFSNVNNQSLSYASYVARGNITPFSSRGPTADGRTKPDIPDLA